MLLIFFSTGSGCHEHIYFGSLRAEIDVIRAGRSTDMLQSPAPFREDFDAAEPDDALATNRYIRHA